MGERRPILGAEASKWTPVESLLWCSHNTTLFARVPQPKVSKTKLVAWVAGADPDCCIFSAFAADHALSASMRHYCKR